MFSFYKGSKHFDDIFKAELTNLLPHISLLKYWVKFLCLWRTMWVKPHKHLLANSILSYFDSSVRSFHIYVVLTLVLSLCLTIASIEANLWTSYNCIFVFWRVCNFKFFKATYPSTIIQYKWDTCIIKLVICRITKVITCVYASIPVSMDDLDKII